MKKLLECLSTSERARKAYAQRLQVTAALVLYRSFSMAFMIILFENDCIDSRLA